MFTCNMDTFLTLNRCFGTNKLAKNGKNLSSKGKQPDFGFTSYPVTQNHSNTLLADKNHSIHRIHVLGSVFDF